MKFLFREHRVAFLQRRWLRQAGEKKILHILKARVIRFPPERFPKPVLHESRRPAKLDDDQQKEYAHKPNEAVPKRDVHWQESGNEQRRQDSNDQKNEQVENLQVV